MVAIAATSWLLGGPAVAERPEGTGLVDDGPAEIDRFQHLRQLSLDLWGRVPTHSELTALLDVDDPSRVPDATVDAMLDDEAFFAFVGRHHRDLLWPNLEQFDLVNPAVAGLLPAFVYELEGSPERLFNLAIGIYSRGGLVPCADEPAVFDDAGEPILSPYPDGTLREGWVMIEPYWAPGTQVKVCALEARTHETAPNGQACTTAQGMFSGGCGCGPELERCMGLEATATVRDALVEQMMRIIEAPIREGRSYFDMLFARSQEVNGPLVHYYRHNVAMALDPFIATSPVHLGALPDIPFHDAQWYPVEFGHEHAGVLTNLLFLLRFQTGRARANRYYTAFLCAPFQAPDLELPSPSDPCSQEPNLKLRCGCNGCHVALEPAASHWARWAEAGASYLAPTEFPAYRAGCDGCGDLCSQECSRFYLTEAGHPDEEPFVGMLQTFLFRDDDELARIGGGPAALAQQHLETGALAHCAVQQAFARLYRRDATDHERDTLFAEWRAGFEASGHDYKALIRAMVTHPSYLRVQR